MKLKLPIIVFLSIWFLNCTCPPVLESKEEIDKLIHRSENIFIGKVFDIDYQASTNSIVVLETFKGKFDIGDTIKCINDNVCGPYFDVEGDWIVFGEMTDYFRPYMCNPSFNIDKPEIYPSPPPPFPGSNEKPKTIDDPEWKKKNRKLAKRILRRVNKIKTVPNKK